MLTFVLPSRVCIIADDLTGAADAAVAFASRSASARVLVEPSDSVKASVRAICTATRDVPTESARLTIRELGRCVDLRDREQIFKKVDSVFRGNTLAEIATCIDTFSERLVVIAPSYPVLGRFCTDDVLRIEDLAGQRVLALRHAFHDVGVQPHWVRAGMGVAEMRYEMILAASRSSHAVFCEATTEDHLRMIAEAGAGLERPVLWVGSGGLAHALAEVMYPHVSKSRPKASPGSLLLFSGSDHAVSMRQLGALRASVLADRTGGEGGSVLEIEVKPGGVDSNKIQASLPQGFCGSVMMNGGDTALTVCRTLGVTAIDLLGEYEAGIPLGVARGGKLDGVTVILKSGGFGDTELLARIALDCGVRKGRDREAVSA